MLETLKTLCLINGTSGREEKVRDYILSRISDKAEITVDNMGNIIAFVRGRKEAKNKVMISAHMDEVGFIIRGITDDGFLKFTTVGGIDEKVIYARDLAVGEKEIPGVVCVRPIHLLEGDEKEKCPKTKDMTIDIGAENKEEAEKYVQVGDSAYFFSDYIEFGDGLIKSKAIDDRFGCAAMIKMIEDGVEYDTYFTFVTQEEIGLRGATAAAFTVAPDYAIVLESTTASDINDTDDINSVCKLGEGAVVSFMDRATLYDRDLFRFSKKVADENNIKWQTKTMVAGGNDAGAIHKSRRGVKTLAVSIPCRYIHSASSVAKKSDLQAVYDLTKKLSQEFANA